MIRLSREQRIYQFSPDNPPAATIQRGDTVIFETEDAASRRILGPEDILTYVARRDYTNPATGPVFVAGAQPGDTLLVHIDRIALDSQGYTKLSPGAGLQINWVDAPAVQIWQIVGTPGNYEVLWGPYALPAKPMIGTIGTAPADQAICNFAAGPHGGNMDVPAVAEGATLYLPVRVPGALLALGDVHGHQGDGEVSGVALETRAVVTTRVELLKGIQWERPWLETERTWITISDALDAPRAMELAVGDMIGLLGQRLALEPHDALMLLGVAGDMRPGQCILAPEMPVTFYLTVPKP